MKIESPQILWHSDEHGKAAALTSVDCCCCRHCCSGSGQPRSGHDVLVTSAHDAVHLWKLDEAAAPKIEFLCALNRHGDDEPVNSVRFSPNGWHLAVAGGGTQGSLCVYSVPRHHQGTDCNSNGNSTCFWSTLRDHQNSELLRTVVAHCGHGITDLDWSRDSRRLVAGTIHHAVFVFEIEPNQKWKTVYRNDDCHTHYVQGVALDPLSTYMASQSSDRTVRVWQRPIPKLKGQVQILRHTNTNSNPIPPNAAATAEFLSQTKFEFHPSKKPKQIKYFKAKEQEDETAAGSSSIVPSQPQEQQQQQLQQEQSQRRYYFCDESTLNSFVRRLAFTVDGAYLICPAAVWGNTYATLLFQRHRWEQPWRVLAGLDAVRGP